MSENNVEHGQSTARKVIAFALTIIAVPVLFVATCFPLGYIGFAISYPASYTDPPHPYGQYAFVAIVGLYTLLFMGFAIHRAVRTKNPGIRWGILAVIGAMVIYAAILAAESWHNLIGMP